MPMKVKRRPQRAKSTPRTKVKPGGGYSVDNLKQRYRTFVHAKAKGERIDDDELGPTLILLGKSWGDFDKDVARVAAQNKHAAKMREADRMQPAIDKLREQISELDQQREKLVAEFRLKADTIAVKRDELHAEYQSQVEIQRNTRHEAQRLLANC